MMHESEQSEAMMDSHSVACQCMALAARLYMTKMVAASIHVSVMVAVHCVHVAEQLSL